MKELSNKKHNDRTCSLNQKDHKVCRVERPVATAGPPGSVIESTNSSSLTGQVAYHAIYWSNISVADSLLCFLPLCLQVLVPVWVLSVQDSVSCLSCIILIIDIISVTYITLGYEKKTKIIHPNLVDGSSSLLDKNEFIHLGTFRIKIMIQEWHESGSTDYKDGSSVGQE